MMVGARQQSRGTLKLFTTLVQDYIDRFTELVDQLVAYQHSSSNHCYYTTRFVDGLKDEIKFVILVQSPVDLDTACSLALLREEAETSRCHEYRKPDFLFKATFRVRFN
jgi:hypothetical protein